MAQSDARFGYKANLNREAHDLNQKFGFSTAPGMLNPIFADIASPGDSYYIKHDLEFLRTAPLAAPAMVDVLVHYETFFVPFQLIYNPFENTFFSLKQNYSSFVDEINLQNNTFPLWDYYYYISQICNTYPTGANRTLAFRLADMFDMQALNFTQRNVTLDSNGEYFNVEDYTSVKYHPSTFPWQLLAYHTIFQYYYRLDDKSNFNNVWCNWDVYYGTTTPVKTASPDLMTIHQRPWNFDYFTSSYHSPIVSDQSMQSVLGGGYFSDLVGGGTFPIPKNGTFALSGNEDIRAFTSYHDGTYNYSVVNMGSSTAMIRQAFANEKLAMITGRTRKNYDSQVLAHFGKKVPHDVKHDITLIGRDTYKLHIGEVTSLASTAGSSLGDLAGKGYCMGKGHDIKFECPCHGIIMTIFSIEPMKRYYSGFNRINAINNAFDLPVPEFDRLGNQPMYQFETGSAQTGQNMTNICAWKERYYQWKRRKDRVSIGFWNPYGVNSANDWEPYFISGWAFGKHNATGHSYANLEERYYIEPEAMDAQMLVPMRLSWGEGGTETHPDEDWSTNPHLVYSHDPFIVDSDMKVKKVSWMSKDGEPIYPY